MPAPHVVPTVSILLLVFGLSPTLTMADECDGNTYAQLEILQPRVSIGETLTLKLSGARLSRTSAIADVGPGPTVLPNIGTICLDLGPKMRILYDGIRNGDRRTRPDGSHTFDVKIPDLPRLRGRALYIQGFIEDETAPNGIAISNLVEIVIDGEIREDFSTTTMRDDTLTTALWNGDGQSVGVIPGTMRTTELNGYEANNYPLAGGESFPPDGFRLQVLVEPFGLPGEKLIGMSWRLFDPALAVPAIYPNMKIRIGKANLPLTPRFNSNFAHTVHTILDGTYALNSVVPGWIPWPSFPEQFPVGEPLVMDFMGRQSGSAMNWMRYARAGYALDYLIAYDVNLSIATTTFYGFKPATQFLLVQTQSHAVSKFYDAGFSRTDFSPAIVDISSMPRGTSITVEYQAGHDADGDGEIEPLSVWTPNVSYYDGHRFLRYRVIFDGHFLRNEVPVIESVTIPVRKR